MTPTRATAGAAMLGLLMIAGLAIGAHRRGDDGRSADRPLPAGALERNPQDLERRDREIAFFERRAGEDPFSAADQSELARRFLRRARSTGSHDDILLAERAARRSLALRTQHNAGTLAVLAAALLEQHRFVEARSVASQLVEVEGENPAWRALLGEIQLELGDHDAARTMFGSLATSRTHLDVAPRLARWEEITGRPDEARALLVASRDEALRRAELPDEQAAGFHLRLADLDLRHGRVDSAEASVRAGLQLAPGEYRLLTALARIEAARGNWPRAIEHGEAALATVLEPATLALLSEVHAASGDTALAAEYADATAISLANAAGAFHRAESLFLLDHGRRVDTIQAQAAEDLRTRRDIHGYDLLAWALHKQGRHAAAREAMTSALRMGTRDALLFYHAGMIERALGNEAAAIIRLRAALAVNPSFHPVHALSARATLDSIRRDRSWFTRMLATR